MHVPSAISKNLTRRPPRWEGIVQRSVPKCCGKGGAGGLVNEELGVRQVLGAPDAESVRKMLRQQ